MLIFDIQAYNVVILISCIAFIDLITMLISRIILIVILFIRIIPGYNQCIGHPNDPYYFCGSISQNTIHLYLQKAASYGYVTEGIINEEMFNDEIGMLQYTNPKWLGRVAGEWQAGENDYQEFSNAVYVANRIHNEVDSSIILQAAIYEHIDKRISNTSDWRIMIPDSIFTIFCNTEYPGYTGYFEFNNIVYEGTEIPDMSKPETQMWFYYRAIQYINAGYESLHMGQFQIMNNRDSLNSGWYKMLTEIRNYAKNYARRKIVLIDCHFVSSQCQDLYFGLNDVPYLCKYKMLGDKTIISPTDTLLFDFISFTLLPDEFLEPVKELSNFYDGYDRLCLINYKDCTLLNKTYVGLEPQQFNNQITLPMLVEMDNGGTNIYDCEGFKTDETYSCNTDMDATLETPEYLTWGFGGESVWYSLQSPGYKHYFSWYAYDLIPTLNENCHVRLNLRMPITYSQAPWPGIIYSAIQDNESDAKMIEWIWNDSLYNLSSNQQIVSKKWVHGNSSMSKSKLKKLSINVDNDILDEIIGVFSDSIEVMNFNEDFSVETTTLISSPLLHTFSFDTLQSGLFPCKVNNDNKQDIILTSMYGILLAVSDIDAYFIVEVTIPQFLDYTNKYKLTKINTGDFNGDGFTDIVFVNDGGIWVALYDSESNSFTEWTLWYNGADSNINLNFLYLQIHTGNLDDDNLYDCTIFDSFGTHILSSNGISFQLTQQFPDHLAITGEAFSKIKYTADLNGDGKSEIIGLDEFGIKVAQINGAQFSLPSYWIYGISEIPDLGGYEFYNSAIITADINGDNKSDIFALGGENSNALLSSGYCFIDPLKLYNHDNLNFNVNNHDVLSGNFIFGTNDEIVIFNEFAVELISFNTSSPSYTIYNLSSIPEFNIYPNPTESYLAIEFSQLFSGMLDIYNLNGQCVYTSNRIVNTFYEEIRLPEILQNGVYILTITDLHNNRKSKKIILL